MNQSFERMPPQDIEAERSVIGSILLNSSAILKVSMYLTENSFYAPSHNYIFSAMRKLNNNSKPVDAVTLSDQMESDGTLDDAGGIAYISDLTSSVPTSANVIHYAKIVEEKYRARKLINAITATLTETYGNGSLDGIISSLRSELIEIEPSQRKDLEHIGELTKKTAEHLGKIREDGGDGVLTGLQDLDYFMGGMSPGEVCILAARPSVGKTAIALNIAINASRVGRKILFYSLEMDAPSLIERMMSINSKFNTYQFKTGYGSSDQVYNELGNAVKELNNLNIYIHDSANLPWDEVQSSSHLHSEQHGRPDLIIIDYIQLMKMRNSNENRQQEVSDISRGIKSMARQLKCPVIALSQLSRAGDVDKPQLSHLRESGSIEQDADYVILASLHSKADDQTNILKLDLAKNRNGMTGICNVVFRKSTQQVLGLAKKPQHMGSREEQEEEEEEKLF